MKDWVENDKIIRDRVLDRGDSVAQCGFMYDYELDWAKDYNTRWYRSKNRNVASTNPFAST